ncbi:DNA binding protein Myb2 [Plasmodium gonderi]|uniref:DNA binding protein Myb2 n=1 Tax=Plasmodium gonderi TaxID=77519 RepID=A0A1Y1JC18_PLAGO|nr:DNA binding protein Myb2 [Plasmodium gonderi]GAW80036.1 DNA binding protein Myb2 [Plasmodium gonderi]
MRIQIKGGIWKNCEDEVLKAAVMKYGLNNWSRVASLLVRKSAKQCKARWYEWLDPSVKKTEWSKEEEEKLLHLAKLFPTQWRTIAPVVGRTAQQCLDHYEYLLDEAEGKVYDKNKNPRYLRPGEIDPAPETKPAKADPVDMDEDEKEMLAEAKARLANTKGKKAKRKAREKQLEQARRLALLQKKRELKAAGITTNKMKYKKNDKNRIDHVKEILFERKPAKGFFDVSEEQTISHFDEKKSNQFKSIKSMDVESIKETEIGGPYDDLQDSEDGSRKKIHFKGKRNNEEKNLLLAIENYDKQFNELSHLRKRVRLNLPEPILNENELEEIIQINKEANSFNQIIKEQNEKNNSNAVVINNILPSVTSSPFILNDKDKYSSIATNFYNKSIAFSSKLDLSIQQAAQNIISRNMNEPIIGMNEPVQLNNYQQGNHHKDDNNEMNKNHMNDYSPILHDEPITIAQNVKEVKEEIENYKKMTDEQQTTSREKNSIKNKIISDIKSYQKNVSLYAHSVLSYKNGRNENSIIGNDTLVSEFYDEDYEEKIDRAKLLIKSSLAHLPKETNVIELQIPDDLNNEDNEETQINSEYDQIEKDIQDIERDKKMQEYKKEKEKFNNQNKIIRWNLPRPYFLQKMNITHPFPRTDMSDTGNSEQVENLVHNEMILLIKNDMFNYPMKSSTPIQNKITLDDVGKTYMKMALDSVQAELQKTTHNGSNSASQDATSIINGEQIMKLDSNMYLSESTKNGEMENVGEATTHLDEMNKDIRKDNQQKEHGSTIHPNGENPSKELNPQCYGTEQDLEMWNKINNQILFCPIKNVYMFVENMNERDIKENYKYRCQKLDSLIQKNMNLYKKIENKYDIYTKGYQLKIKGYKKTFDSQFNLYINYMSEKDALNALHEREKKYALERIQEEREENKKEIEYHKSLQQLYVELLENNNLLKQGDKRMCLKHAGEGEAEVGG